MKKFLALILALCMVMALAACGGGNADPTKAPETGAPTGEPTAEPTVEPTANPYADMTLDELKAELKTVTDGKLTVATSPDFAPYEFYAIDEDGKPQLAGFDLALAKYIADALGLELEIVEMDFDGALMEVQMGNVDMTMAGLSPDPDREETMSFSDLYYMGGQSFVTVKGGEDKFPSLEDANNADFSIGAQIGSIQAKLADKHTPDADVIQLAKVTDIISELLSGKLDGAFIETDVAKSYQVNYPELAIVLDVPYENVGSAIGVMKGNDVLLAAVNLIIAQVLDDGTMTQFIDEANDAAAGDVHLGLLDENGDVPEETAEPTAEPAA